MTQNWLKQIFSCYDQYPMNTSQKTRNQIYSTTHASRETIVGYLKMLGQQSKNLPARELLLRRDYAKASSRTEMAKGESMAAEIASAILWQDWINYDTADDLVEICELASNLEINYDNPGLWQRLWDKIDALKA